MMTKISDGNTPAVRSFSDMGRTTICFFCRAISCLILWTAAAMPANPVPPASVSIGFTEKSLDISWDSVPGATGYNIYTAEKPRTPGNKRFRINNQLIQSGTHFTYLWHFENDQKVRKIKGYRHYISVTAVFDNNGKLSESGFSPERDNRYFDGFERMTALPRIEAVLRDTQQTPPLPVDLPPNSRERFRAFMTGPGRQLAGLVAEKLDPRATGGCTPVTTVLVMLLADFGIVACRADGHFIREFHTFAVLKIDNVEYVLDFTADQFVPDVMPVLVPRDLCHLDERGKLSSAGTPVYTIARLFTADQISLNDDETAETYRGIYQSVRAAIAP